MRLIHLLVSGLAVWAVSVSVATAQDAAAPKPAAPKGLSGSMIEDRSASKLLDAGQARYDADEPAKAVEIWQSVIERYPRSRVRFAAHLLLGKHFLDRERAYDRARVHFEVAAGEDNPDADRRSEALMRAGACYYHLRNYGKSFQLMRDLIDRFPGSPYVNDAYYYIGLGHFQLGHYSRAIAALENVGTAMTADKGSVPKVEAGKRLFVRLDDADLAIFDPQQPIIVRADTTSGDREDVSCFLVARHGRMALGSIPTRLGRPVRGNGRLEIQGDDKVTITYIDQHTAEKEMNRKVLRTVEVVGTATVRITDGAFAESLMGVVLGKDVNIQITDGDCDLSDKPDTIKATVIVCRPKSDEEIQAEAAKAAGAADPPAREGNAGIPARDPSAKGKRPRVAPAPAEPLAPDAEKKIDPLREISRREVVLTEVRLPRRVEKTLDDMPLPEASTRPTTQPAGREPLPPSDMNMSDPGKDLLMDLKPATQPTTQNAPAGTQQTQPATQPATTHPLETVVPPVVVAAAPKEEPDDGTTHTGVFRVTIPLEKAPLPSASGAPGPAGGEKAGDGSPLLAQSGDVIRVIYLDQRHAGEGVREVAAQAKCLEGNIGAVRVSHALISDQELRIQTELKTAGALTNIGNRYKEFGLKTNADDKYKQALAVCEDIMAEASRLGGRVLEETYVQLWRIYFEMERLDLAAAMCQRLQQQFPSSGFVDEALIQLAAVARKQNDLNRAIRTYSSVLGIRTSPLRGEAQFGIAECYDQMAKTAIEAAANATGPGAGAAAAAQKARAFEEYKKVYDQFPDSGRVGDAVARMAEYYYDQKDYPRAVEVFDNVLANQPDAKFLDVILFNYARCLYRMDRKDQALAKFEQLLTEFPDSPLAGDAKKIIEAMRKMGK